MTIAKDGKKMEVLKPFEMIFPVLAYVYYSIISLLTPLFVL